MASKYIKIRYDKNVKDGVKHQRRAKTQMLKSGNSVRSGSTASAPPSAASRPQRGDLWRTTAVNGVGISILFQGYPALMPHHDVKKRFPAVSYSFSFPDSGHMKMNDFCHCGSKACRKLLIQWKEREPQVCVTARRIYKDAYVVGREVMFTFAAGKTPKLQKALEADIVTERLMSREQSRESRRVELLTHQQTTAGLDHRERAQSLHSFAEILAPLRPEVMADVEKQASRIDLRLDEVFEEVLASHRQVLPQAPIITDVGVDLPIDLVTKPMRAHRETAIFLLSGLLKISPIVLREQFGLEGLSTQGWVPLSQSRKKATMTVYRASRFIHEAGSIDFSSPNTFQLLNVVDLPQPLDKPMPKFVNKRPRRRQRRRSSDSFEWPNGDCGPRVFQLIIAKRHKQHYSISWLRDSLAHISSKTRDWWNSNHFDEVCQRWNLRVVVHADSFTTAHGDPKYPEDHVLCTRGHYSLCSPQDQPAKLGFHEAGSKFVSDYCPKFCQAYLGKVAKSKGLSPPLKQDQFSLWNHARMGSIVTACQMELHRRHRKGERVDLTFICPVSKIVSMHDISLYSNSTDHYRIASTCHGCWDGAFTRINGQAIAICEFHEAGNRRGGRQPGRGASKPPPPSSSSTPVKHPAKPKTKRKKPVGREPTVSKPTTHRMPQTRQPEVVSLSATNDMCLVSQTIQFNNIQVPPMVDGEDAGYKLVWAAMADPGTVIGASQEYSGSAQVAVGTSPLVAAARTHQAAGHDPKRGFQILIESVLPTTVSGFMLSLMVSPVEMRGQSAKDIAEAVALRVGDKEPNSYVWHINSTTKSRTFKFNPNPTMLLFDQDSTVRAPAWLYIIASNAIYEPNLGGGAASSSSSISGPPMYEGPSFNMFFKANLNFAFKVVASDFPTISAISIKGLNTFAPMAFANNKKQIYGDSNDIQLSTGIPNAVVDPKALATGPTNVLTIPSAFGRHMRIPKNEFSMFSYWSNADMMNINPSQIAFEPSDFFTATVGPFLGNVLPGIFGKFINSRELSYFFDSSGSGFLTYQDPNLVGQISPASSGLAVTPADLAQEQKFYHRFIPAGGQYPGTTDSLAYTVSMSPPLSSTTYSTSVSPYKNLLAGYNSHSPAFPSTSPVSELLQLVDTVSSRTGSFPVTVSEAASLVGSSLEAAPSYFSAAVEWASEAVLAFLVQPATVVSAGTDVSEGVMRVNYTPNLAETSLTTGFFKPYFLHAYSAAKALDPADALGWVHDYLLFCKNQSVNFNDHVMVLRVSSVAPYVHSSPFHHTARFTATDYGRLSKVWEPSNLPDSLPALFEAIFPGEDTLQLVFGPGTIANGGQTTNMFQGRYPTYHCRTTYEAATADPDGDWTGDLEILSHVYKNSGVITPCVARESDMTAPSTAYLMNFHSPI